jgi:hypothetical protein
MAELQHFSGAEIKLTKEEAFRILRFFWIEPGIDPGNLTDSDAAFAQALLVEAIDSSYAMGYVELVYENFFGKVPTSFSALKDTVKSFAKAAAKHWFKHATRKDLEDPKIYESVRRTLAYNFGSAWRIRLQTNEPVIY